MKKEWKAPTAEVLDINMTMAGPGQRIDDALTYDPDEHLHHS